MRRPAKRSSSRLSAESQRLVNSSQAVAGSTSRLEERAWERSLDLLLHKQLKSSHQGMIDSALDHLFKSDLEAYDVLVEAVEANSEACALEYDGKLYSVQLLALPVLAWTRFSIASGNLPADVRNGLFAHLHAHVLADNAHLALAPTLYAIEQLPRHHADVFALAQRMGQAALKQSQPQLALEQTPTARFLPGCNVELLLPQPYYFACREADKRIRPAAIRAADHYLTQTLGVASSELHANIGSFCENINGQIDEYRIGFNLADDDGIVYGIVWPLYEQEDGDEVRDLSEPESAKTPIEEILEVLRECGIVHIKLHAERYTMEFCDDCGTPLFPAPDGDLVHAEMPEDVPASTEHFH